MEIGKLILKNKKIDIVKAKKHKLIKNHETADVLFVTFYGMSSFLVLLPFFLFKDMKSLIDFVALAYFILIGVAFTFFSKYQSKVFEKIEKLPDSEIISLLSSEELKKYNVKIGDTVFYTNGFKFTESCVKFFINKISEDGKTLLLLDENKNYKEISIDQFLSNDYVV